VLPVEVVGQGFVPRSADAARVGGYPAVQPVAQRDPTRRPARSAVDEAEIEEEVLLVDRVVGAGIGLVADGLADRYRSSRGTSREDLTQTARAALVAAVDRYDPTRERGFVPFAVACVVGELKRYLRDATWRLPIPRSLKDEA
jgi:DNA-directed RNA polymerase specialized sigma subunit